MDTLQSAFSGISLSERCDLPHAPYEALAMLRERYGDTLLGFFTAKVTFDADLTLVFNEPAFRGFIPPTHLIIMIDNEDKNKVSYFPTHDALWNIASGYPLPPRNPALPWNRLQPFYLVGGVHKAMSFLHTLLYGIILPPELIRGYADAAREVAIHLRMPYLVRDIDELKNGYVFFEEDEDNLEE
ncbi:hypothetical protein DL96DRAFT_1813976 [Flagelloscypha sp. PMI_526]|nr:hypothetical protein DL96DRAFT_1813976 [Flagelloscypha sp. PMI_526]